MENWFKKSVLKVLSAVMVALFTINSFSLNVSAASIPADVYRSVKPDTTVYTQKVRTPYFVAGSFSEAKSYVENLGTFNNCDYIYYETQTEYCYHYYAYHMPQKILSAGQSFTVTNCINGASNPSPSTYTFTAPYQSSATKDGPYAQMYGHQNINHNLWYYWYFTIEAVAYNSVDRVYEPTICRMLGYDQGRTMKGGLLNGWKNTGGFDETNQYIWGSATGYHGSTVDWRYSPVGGYGLHMNGVCYCHSQPDSPSISPYFGYETACLSDGYSHRTTMYRFTGDELNCVKIDIDKKGGIGGSDIFYEYYGVSFNKTYKQEDIITSILVPTREGYDFGGYYSTDTGSLGINLGSGAKQIVDANGKILVNNKYYTGNSKVYGYWIPHRYNVNVHNNKPVDATSNISNIK